MLINFMNNVVLHPLIIPKDIWFIIPQHIKTNRTIFAKKKLQMLQVAFIRNNPELVRERLAIKYFTDTTLIDKIIGLDDERKKLQFEYDETQSKINITSK